MERRNRENVPLPRAPPPPPTAGASIIAEIAENVEYVKDQRTQVSEVRQAEWQPSDTN